MSINEQDAGAGLNRRAVIKAAAWSAPVVAVAIATPLAAASVDPGPRPAPAGLTEWQGGTSVSTSIVNPAHVLVNRGATVGFVAFTPDGDDLEQPGVFTSGEASVSVTWGAGGNVTEPTSYRLEESNLNGWTRVGALPGAGTTGTVQYVHTGILNGAANVVSLPLLRLYPTAGGSLTQTYVSTTLASEHLSEKTSGARVP